MARPGYRRRRTREWQRRNAARAKASRSPRPSPTAAPALHATKRRLGGRRGIRAPTRDRGRGHPLNPIAILRRLLAANTDRSPLADHRVNGRLSLHLRQAKESDCHILYYSTLRVARPHHPQAFFPRRTQPPRMYNAGPKAGANGGHFVQPSLSLRAQRGGRAGDEARGYQRRPVGSRYLEPSPPSGDTDLAPRATVVPEVSPSSLRSPSSCASTLFCSDSRDISSA